MTPVTLHEYRPQTLRLTDGQVLALRAAKAHVVPLGAGLHEVTPQSTVGSLRIDGTVFTIRPKVGIRRLMYLASYATDRIIDDDRLSQLHDEDDLLDAMAWLYGHAVDDATARGVRRGYRRVADVDTTVRGRIDIARQLRRRHGRSYPIEVEYDDFTIDTNANRLLLAAALRLARIGGVRGDTRRRLARAARRLEGVTPMTWRTAPPPVRLSRLDAHYGTAIALARLVLASRSIEPVAGVTEMSAMLINLNNVFEDFVVRALRKRLQLDEHAFPQNCRGHRLLLAEDGVNLEPDLSWWEGDRCVFVGDVKYKKVNAAGIKHPDLYQLLAYAVATDLDEALLVYAAGEQPVTHRVVHIGRRLHIVTMDLGGPLPALRWQLDRLANRVATVADVGQDANVANSTSV